MNRFQHWLRARTRYNLHSPFLFALYDKVLTARLDDAVVASLPRSPRCDRRYHELVYMMTDYFSMREVESIPDTAVLEGEGEVKKAVVMCRPHRSRQTEARWHQLCADKSCNVSIDMFDVGIVLNNPHLLPQQFLLK